MNKDNNNKKKKEYNYPISKNKQQCIGPCYAANTKIIHPLTLEEIDAVDHNFCPVNTFVLTNPDTKKNELYNVDICMVPTEREMNIDSMIKENVVLPQFVFSSEYFVKIYYKISNLDDLLNWLDTNRLDPYRTKERVFNNSMTVYGDQLNILDNRIIQYINDVMIENLPKLYRHLKYYIVIENGIIVLKNPESDVFNNISSNDPDNNNISLIRSYIKEKFLGSDNINQFMSKIIRYYKEDISNRNAIDNLVNHMIDYIIKRIKLTLEQNQ
jgi:hypothetical protein